MNGADLGAAMARWTIAMMLIAFAVGIATVIGGWALWHFVLSHMHWSWS